MPFVLALPVSATTGVVDNLDTAEVIGGFAFTTVAIVIGALVATALRAVGEGDLMAAFVNLNDFIKSSLKNYKPLFCNVK